ncbi:MAG: TraB/GumN family protein [Pseudomonadota bacterium]|nr:TraB/GumN family protein [Pseudomonadota bacterium]
MKAHRNPFACVWCLLGVLLAGVAQAQERPLEKSLLFEVRNDNGKPSYLFGTIHSEDDRVLELPPPVQDAFDRSRALAMEAVPDAAAIIRSMVTMVYTDGRTLEDVVGPSLYRETVKAMETIGMTETAFKDFKPWAIVTLLSVPRAQTGEFLDMRLYKAALADGKSVVGLETIDEQLAVFESLSEGDQVAMLRETLAVRDQLSEVFERLLSAYVQRDLAELMRLSNDYLHGGDPALAERFEAAALDARNVRMVERMLPLLAEGGYFVAVGALHFPGEGGILERLLAAGLDVRPVY